MTHRTKPNRGRHYIVKVLNGMAHGLFASLIIGLIIRQIGDYSGMEALSHFGQFAQLMMGPAIGAGVAMSVGASPLGVFAATVTGAIGAGTIRLGGAAATVVIGEPVGAMLAALAGAEFSRLIHNRTKLNIILVPAASIVVGGVTGALLAPAVAALMSSVGEFINALTGLYPLPMGVLVAVTMGMVLTLPISSAAIAISLGISGLAAGAATIGCASQMVGFAVASFRENGWGGLVSQGLGTSMLQIPNIVRNPLIWVPPTVTSAILGPVGTVIFAMENNRVGAGMGTSGLVGQFATVQTMGPSAVPAVLLLHFLLPALLTLIISETMRRSGLIKPGDMLLRDDSGSAQSSA